MWGMLMLEQYETLRNDIRHYAIKTKDYAKTVRLCLEYLNKLNMLSIDEEFKKDDKNFIYYEIALNSKKNGDFQTAIKYTLISLNYIRGDIGVRYINRLWMIAVCYTNIGHIKEAKRIYYKCSKLFKQINEQKQRALIIFNNAKLMKNFKAMKQIIKIYESNMLNESVQTYGDMEYDDVLKSLYTELVELYIVENRRQDAFNIIYAIGNRKVRKELSLKLVS
jgi:tetratricopeptide (TPR) repeat protein